MKALIFAAGFGSRLRPLTDNIPKAMVRVGGKTMLEWVAEKLIAAGVSDIVVNVHHRGRMLENFIFSLDYPGIRFHISDEKEKLLDTGGGLKKAESMLKGEGPFFIHNVDVLSDISLTSMLSTHLEKRPLATLAVSRRESSRRFLWQDGLLTGWENRISGERIFCREESLDGFEPLAFSGVHLVEPSVFELIKEKGAFSINSLYLRLAENHPIMAFRHDAGNWADIGTPEKLIRAGRLMAANPGIFR